MNCDTIINHNKVIMKYRLMNSDNEAMIRKTRYFTME